MKLFIKWVILAAVGMLILGLLGQCAARAEDRPDAIACLALNIYHEARGETIDAQFAVAQVTLNRADRKQENVCGVVQAPKQFSWTIKPQPVTDLAAYRHSQAVARLSLALPDFTGGATHYHTITTTPYWTPGMVVTGQWGNHIFYKVKGRR